MALRDHDPTRRQVVAGLAAMAGFATMRPTLAAGPAATTASLAASAASGRPKTGAATYSCPAFACSAVKRSLSAALIVLSET